MGHAREQFASRIAIVVSDPLHHGLARIGGSYAEPSGFEVEVFRDLETARAWLSK
jgi:hypothetical protein